MKIFSMLVISCLFAANAMAGDSQEPVPDTVPTSPVGGVILPVLPGAPDEIYQYVADDCSSQCFPITSTGTQYNACMKACMTNFFYDIFL